MTHPVPTNGAPVLLAPRLATAAALVWFGAVSFWPVFDDRSVPRLMTVAAAAPAAAAFLPTCFGRGLAGLRVVAGMAAATACSALVATPVDAVVQGPRALLTSGLPIDPDGPELAAVALGVGMAAVLAAELTIRLRAPLPAVLPGLAVLAAGSAVAGSLGQSPVWAAVAGVAGAGLLLVLAQHRADRSARPEADKAVPGRPRPAGSAAAPRRARRLLGGLLLTAAAAAVVVPGAALPGAALARDKPFDVRELVDPPVGPYDTEEPLVRLAQLRSRVDSLELAVRRPPPRPDGGALLMRLVTLDRFDGVRWTTSTDYRRAGRRLPRPVGVSGGAEFEETIIVRSSVPLGWVISSGLPIETSVRGLGVNEQTGVVVFGSDMGTPPTTYWVRSLPAPDDATLQNDTPQRVTAGSDASVPAALRGVAASITARTGFDMIKQARNYFRGKSFYRVDPTRSDAPIGSGIQQVEQLLRTFRGTDEQYASAFALVVRAMGYQSRLVIVANAQPVDAAVDEYRAATPDLEVRAEVRFGQGWMTFTPTPEHAAPGETPPPRRVAAGAGDRASDDRLHSAAPPPRPAPATVRTAGGRTGVWAALRAALAGLGGAAVMAVLAVPLLKAVRRRRRRRAPVPSVAVAGAWSDTVERLVEVRIRVSAAMTTGEVVSAAQPSCPDAEITLLGRYADRAAYGAGDLSSAEADRAWRAADTIRMHIRRGQSPARRLLAATSPRPLRTVSWRRPAGRRSRGGPRRPRGVG